MFVLLVCVRSDRRPQEREMFILKSQVGQKVHMCRGRRRGLSRCRCTTVDVIYANGCVTSVSWRQWPLEAAGCWCLLFGQQVQLEDLWRTCFPQRSFTKWRHRRAPSQRPLLATNHHHWWFRDLQTYSFLVMWTHEMNPVFSETLRVPSFQ